MSNVALPDIGQALSATNQPVGDRYGRKRLLLLGAALCIPFSILSSLAHDWQWLVLAQMATGVGGGMLYPTTLSLITALFSGRSMTRAIALWTGIGAGASVFGPLAGGFPLEHFAWGSVFLVTVPCAAAVFGLALWLVPRPSGEGAGRIDHPGGVPSVVAVASFVLMVVLLPQGVTPAVVCLFVAAVVAGALFVPRAPEPLFDLCPAKGPTARAPPLSPFHSRRERSVRGRSGNTPIITRYFT